MIVTGPELLKLARSRAGMTAAEAAHAVGVSRATMTRWENGQRTPDAYELVRLFAIYAETGQVDMSELLEAFADSAMATLTG